MQAYLQKLRAALDEIEEGVVLLDEDLVALTINRAFRRMWRLPDAKADANPHFRELMQHGAATRAYAVTDGELETYIAEREAQVRRGRIEPMQIRRADGSILGFQCIDLSIGGRLLLYADITERARMAERLRERELAARQSQARLVDAVESLNDGFALYDRDDRLVLFNHDYAASFGPVQPLVRPGVTFEALLRASLEATMLRLGDEQPEDYVVRRLNQRRAGRGHLELGYADGRTFRVSDRRTTDGGTVTLLTDVSEVRRAQAQLEALAVTDPLTGVANRRGFLEACRRELTRAQRTGRPVSLAILDADRFKSVNDTYGHEVGDRVLLAIATGVGGALRRTDMLGRLGGEEFGILLPETALAGAAELAERLRRHLADLPVPTRGGAVRFTVSIGVAVAEEGSVDVEALLRVADQALYAAKNGGRDRVVAQASAA